MQIRRMQEERLNELTTEGYEVIMAAAGKGLDRLLD